MHVNYHFVVYRIVNGFANLVNIEVSFVCGPAGHPHITSTTKTTSTPQRLLRLARAWGERLRAESADGPDLRIAYCDVAPRVDAPAHCAKLYVT